MIVNEIQTSGKETVKKKKKKVTEATVEWRHKVAMRFC